ncbi:hypothetical protein PHMEG_0008067 [Phytophthora megakarya]|uniref:Uncharacterized protein n=1 Tax=Phytophthora megakarya TaxID=4795 RepID=A0A225WLC4_9STRA|nr:hypothetical protein PHMEG_0008067 [Phytophthora megakarya]
MGFLGDDHQIINSCDTYSLSRDLVLHTNRAIPLRRDDRFRSNSNFTNKQKMTVSERTVKLHVFKEEFRPYVGDFLVLKTVNLDIDWISGGLCVSGGGSTLNWGGRYFQHGFYLLSSGETKSITGKQFKRLRHKPHELECVFVVRPITEKRTDRVRKSCCIYQRLQKPWRVLSVRASQGSV